ncbi:MAG: rhomboid family intramembrane serine protease [Acidimicrobiia bacterium]|nr:rhomboid family intramembrane serine protease [Acidimicrobiia bacterium]
MPDDATPRKAAARFVPLAVFVAGMWVIEFFDLIVRDGALDAYGILPRSLDGLDGVLWAPWLHAGLGHLASNTAPLLLLGALVAMRGPGRWLFVTGFVIIAGGLGTWFFARPSIHIGASIVVFGYITYLVAVGFYERRLRSMLIGLAVLIVYGGTLLSGVLAVQSRVSWEGHLFGALAGLVAAWLAGARRTRAITDTVT